MTSAYLYTSPLRVILLLTSSLACNVGVGRKREGVNSTTRAPADFKYVALHPQLTDRPGLLGQNNMSSNHTVTKGAPVYSPQRHLNAKHQHPRMDQSVNEVHAGDHRPDYVTADDESDFDDTLTSLFASSSPGDMLDDAEIDELMNAQGLWRSSSNTVAKHLRPVVRILAGDDGLVSREMYRQLSKLIVYIAIPFIIIGVVTNVIALKVFRRLPRSVTNTHMTCLVCFDMAYLLFMVTSHLVVVIFRAASAQSSAKHFLHLYVVYKFCILCARQVIVVATAMMSLDRYFVIASPFRTSKMVIFRRPRLVLLVGALVILAFNSHKLLKREVKTGQFPGSNHTVSYLGYSRIYLDNHGLLDDLTIASSCLFQYCPLFAMLVANTSLMISLYRYSRRVSAVKGGVKLGSITSRSSKGSSSPPAGQNLTTSVTPRVSSRHSSSPPAGQNLTTSLTPRLSSRRSSSKRRKKNGNAAFPNGFHPPLRDSQDLTACSPTPVCVKLDAYIQSPETKPNTDVENAQSTQDTDVEKPQTKQHTVVKGQQTKLDTDVQSPQTKQDTDAQSPHTKQDTDAQSPHTKQDTDAQSPHTKQDTDAQSPHTKQDTDVQSSQTQLDTDVQSSKPKLDTDVQSSKTRLDTDVQSSKTKLDTDVQSSKTKLDTVFEGQQTKQNTDVQSPRISIPVQKALLTPEPGMSHHNGQVSRDSGPTDTVDPRPSTRVARDAELSSGSEPSINTLVRSRNYSGKRAAKAERQFFQLERHKCVTVIIYSFLFFILALPLALLPILKKAIPEFNVFKSQHYLFLIYVRIFPLLDIISASINFFVFFIKGEAFRAGVRRIVKCQKGGHRHGTFKLRSLGAESEGKDNAASTRSSVLLKGSIKSRNT